MTANQTSHFSSHDLVYAHAPPQLLDALKACAMTCASLVRGYPRTSTEQLGLLPHIKSFTEPEMGIPKKVREHFTLPCASRKYGHKAADCWYKKPPKPQGKGNGTGKSKVTEISESDSSEQVEETWTPDTSAQPSSLSQVNTIGCADEGTWIFSLEDSKKRRYTVNWEDQTDRKPEEHELVIDTGCFGHVCPPWPMRIKPDNMIFLVKRKLQEHFVLLNRRQMLREWHTTRHTFHSEIGAHSVLRVVDEVLRAQKSCGEQDSGHSAGIPDGLHVHSNGGREQNSAMYHIRGNAQWSGDQLHVRPEKWL